MASITLERVPETRSQWLAACRKNGILDPKSDSIHDRSVVLKPGSQVGNGQFFLLRVICLRPKKPFLNNVSLSNEIVPNEYLSDAREALTKSPSFQACLEWLKTPDLSLATPQSQRMGAFVLLFQSQRYTRGLDSADSSKVEFSPISSRIRSKVQPKLESRPKTPSTPTPLRSDRTNHTVGSSSVDMSDMDVDMEDENFSSPVFTNSPLTGEEARQANCIKNEQEVVFCLLTLLRAVCILVPETECAMWKADQVEYTLDDTGGEKIFSAKTDINLEYGHKKGCQVIGETKKALRYAENDGGAPVKAQEACQMTGWAFKEPPSDRKLKQMREEKSTAQYDSPSFEKQT